MFFCILVMCVVFIVIVFLLFFFFVKQKPAYEMRIRYWSSDVCSSDLDEGHLLAPHHAGSARDAETRRIGVATLTDLCARGRKRGIAPVIATQRLAKLNSSVVSELQNFLVGLNVFDRDIEIGRASCREGVCQYV